ncbi:hypothetical protein Aab01nite_77760 [Paractinoplanes abujensis]|uniref:Fatty acid desaturase n=1 Tax=Paractinoplanes abujensis TaxID=882441 RepID=A0A7W7G348_9ACTN|nr:hypothetical protein [Actinoplanes abujensis]MBB4692336.1 fatty acid desaturase [Actinoplanes abujensis]GID24186.1 hypothetical protein Aab01nite_77760 [Actinoplanes abujensis]
MRLPSVVVVRAAFLAVALLIVLIGVVGWPAVLLGAAFAVWFTDTRRPGRKA